MATRRLLNIATVLALTPALLLFGAPGLNTAAHATPWPGASFGVFFGDVPGEPGNVRVKLDLNNDRWATVTWAAPASDGGAEITSYRVRATPHDPTEAILGAIVNPWERSQRINLVDPGTDYTYTVQANNSVGAGPAVEAVFEEPPAVVPGEPGNVRVKLDLDNDRWATVTWAAPASDGGAEITSYRVRATPHDPTEAILGAIVNPWERSQRINLVDPGTDYTYTVQANNSVGAGPAVEATALRRASVVGGSDTALDYGKGTQMHVTVDAGAVRPTGRVLLTAGGVVLGGAELVDGVAAAPITARKLGPGLHEVTVAYRGDRWVRVCCTNG
ncbi:fibronectin type III domain-containing protein [Nocardioides pelophilus]|uniref:fibronectin type III domain-containing protein n=1 Tax=Nocardioides pelophilus TaxID=2172019 RepID=UPI0015FF22C1|nr:fibronectin type III domain-containing protein [Nocardioides pelophilus]